MKRELQSCIRLCLIAVTVLLVASIGAAEALTEVREFPMQGFQKVLQINLPIDGLSYDYYELWDLESEYYLESRSKSMMLLAVPEPQLTLEVYAYEYDEGSDMIDWDDDEIEAFANQTAEYNKAEGSGVYYGACGPWVWSCVPNDGYDYIEFDTITEGIELVFKFYTANEVDVNGFEERMHQILDSAEIHADRTEQAAIGGDTMSIPEQGIELTFPEGIYAFTREMKADSPNMKALDLLPSVAETFLDACDAEVMAADEGWNVMFTLSETDMEMVYDLSNCDEKELKDFCGAIASLFTIEADGTVEYEIYHGATTNWGCFRRSPSTLDYITAENGKAYYLQASTFADTLRAEDEDMLRQIADSVIISKVEGAELAGSVYTDQEMRISFIVPSGYEQEELSKERKVLKAKYFYTAAAEEPVFGVILYSSMDAWSEDRARMEVMGMTVEEYDEQYLAFNFRSMAEATFGDQLTDTSVRELAGKKFYTASAISQMDGVRMPTTMATFMKNGIAYVFQYYGTEDLMTYGKFIEMLSSVKTLERE